MSQEIYQHFAAEDVPFIDKCTEWLGQVEAYYAPVLTPFLNPYQVSILQTLGNRFGIKVFSSHDYVSSDYARVLLAPDYFQPCLSDFEMTLLEIVYPSKFEQLTHAQILGTILNRLGINRKLFGDILVTNTRAQIIVDQKFITLFQDGIQKIARLPVTLQKRPFSDLLSSNSDYQEKEILLSSLRLDAFLSKAWNISRSQTVVLLTKRSVQVNYKIVNKSDYQIKVGDLISVRRFGRIRVIRENGITKKDKKKLMIQLLVSK